ncbi:MAG TPA: FUSC family protein [Verrucomicrobiae bacterium]|nr:FUSC family protein [Verrucomicrobiae bacterium]
MQPRHLEAVIYSTKAAASALAGVVSYQLAHLPGSPWVAAVSAVIVTQTSLHSSLKASLMRVAANLAGAFGGALLSLVIGQPLVAMAIGIMLTGLICYALKQDEMLRPAFVAVILVTLAGETGQWRTSLNRVVGVLVGCACALVIGFLFDKLSGWVKLPDEVESNKSDSPE